MNFFDIENIKIFNIYKDFSFLESKEINSDTVKFFQDGLGKFILYSIIVFLFASLSGILSSKLLRFLKLDIKFKIFRFKNQWYYIFSGEVLDFEKFRIAKNVQFNELPENQNVLLTYADVLVSNNQGNRELYTGYVVDYDLNQDDISKLEKLYLLDAFRYKKPNSSNYFEANDKTSFSSTSESFRIIQISNESYNSSRLRVSIPGDLLVLAGENIQNINLTYIPSKKMAEIKSNKKDRTLKKVLYSIFLINSILIILHLILPFINYGEYSFIDNYKLNTTFLEKIVLLIYFYQFTAIGIPSKDELGNYSYNFKKSMLPRILVFILITISVYVYYIN
jgi:fumarate reductase subunit D